MATEPLTTVLAALMMAYAANVTSLPLPANPPSVDLATNEQIQVEIFGSYDPTRLAEAYGYYDPDTDTIVLPDTWAPYSAYALAQLAHEATHYLQDQADPGALEAARVNGSRGDLERTAYYVQFKLLADLGSEDPIADSGLTKLQLWAATRTTPAFAR
jgi:hypothetical protein